MHSVRVAISDDNRCLQPELSYALFTVVISANNKYLQPELSYAPFTGD